jgi:hypothetical protein
VSNPSKVKLPNSAVDVDVTEVLKQPRRFTQPN